MPVFVVVQIDVHDPATYDTYKNAATETIGMYGGRYALRGGSVKTLEGTWNPKRFVILEFPTAERAEAWWNSPEYAGPKSIRQRCATTEMILVEGPSVDFDK